MTVVCVCKIRIRIIVCRNKCVCVCDCRKIPSHENWRSQAARRNRVRWSGMTDILQSHGLRKEIHLHSYMIC